MNEKFMTSVLDDYFKHARSIGNIVHRTIGYLFASHVVIKYFFFYVVVADLRAFQLIKRKNSVTFFHFAENKNYPCYI